MVVFIYFFLYWHNIAESAILCGEDLSLVPRSKQEEEEKGPGFSQYVLNDYPFCNT